MFTEHNSVRWLVIGHKMAVFTCLYSYGQHSFIRKRLLCWLPWEFPLIALLCFLGQEAVGGLPAFVRHHDWLGALRGQRRSRGSSCQGEGEGGTSRSQRKVERLINFVCTHSHDYYLVTAPPPKDITISHRHFKMLMLSLTFTVIQGNKVFWWQGCWHVECRRATEMGW